MSRMYILVAILLIGGAAALGISSYIQSQIDQGKEQITQAEDTVEKGEKILSLRPETKAVGEGLSRKAHTKIAEGESLIAHYETISSFLKIVGIVLIVSAGSIFVICRKKKR